MWKKYVQKPQVQDYSIDLDFYSVRTKNIINTDILYFLACVKGKKRGYALPPSGGLFYIFRYYQTYVVYILYTYWIYSLTLINICDKCIILVCTTERCNF